VGKDQPKDGNLQRDKRETSSDLRVIQESDPMQLMPPLISGVACGQLPDSVGSKGDICQGEKDEEPVVAQDERSRQDVPENNLSDGKARPHGSTPMKNNICPLTSPLEEVENILDTN
jgi:hypothetical protein